MDRSLWWLMFLLSESALLGWQAVAACPYNDQACRCTGHTLLCTNLVVLPTLVNNNDDGSITNLTFQSGNLNSIPDNSLPANLQTLIFSNMNINSISPDALSGSSDTLKSFSIKKGNYNNVLGALQKISSLNELVVTDANIPTWQLEVLQKVGNTVRSAAFVNVGLTAWPEWLKCFTSLNSLNLSSNALENIPGDAFRNVRNLTTLVLRSASLSDENNLNVALIPVKNSLEYLDLSVNRFLEIPSSLVNMPRIHTLMMQLNWISEITSGRIPPQLKVLDLSMTHLERLNDNSFTQSSSLEKLFLAYSQLVYISDLAFQPLQQLRGLQLAGIHVPTVPLALTQLPNLQVLIMTDIINLECDCPVDHSLLRWYQHLKKITVTGHCQSGFRNTDVASYLSQDKTKSPCSGFNQLKVNLLPYLLVVLVTAIEFL